MTEWHFYSCSHQLGPVVNSDSNRPHMPYFHRTPSLFRRFEILTLLLKKLPNLKTWLNEKEILTCNNADAYFTTPSPSQCWMNAKSLSLGITEWAPICYAFYKILFAESLQSSSFKNPQQGISEKASQLLFACMPVQSGTRMRLRQE